MKILITGANGFVGKNARLFAGELLPDAEFFLFDLDSTEAELDRFLDEADLIFHLAGVNRPKVEDEFQKGNADFTRNLCEKLLARGKTTPIVFSSSVQAGLDNPYGISKKGGEDALRFYANRGGAVVVYRFQNLFGKMCRPNYNSVTATFCYNIANDLPITVNDPERELELVHIDDVCAALIDFAKNPPRSGAFEMKTVAVSYKVKLGELAEKIRAFNASRTNLIMPSLKNRFDQLLYSTFLSYLTREQTSYYLDLKTDPRGALAEFIKSVDFGQIFISRTKPGITRGNHYHHSKTEKFLVLEGKGIVRFRNILTNETMEFPVDGQKWEVVDILPGWTHSIENVGSVDMITLFWASELFDPQRADTYYQPVIVDRN